MNPTQRWFMIQLIFIGTILSILGLAEAAKQPWVEEKLDQRAEAPTYGKGDSWVFKVDRTLPKPKYSTIDEIQKGGEFDVTPRSDKRS